MNPKEPKENIIELLNDIHKIPESSLLEKLISYCEENDILPQELGDILGESEQFKRVLWINAVQNNQIHDTPLQNKITSTEELDEW